MGFFFDYFSNKIFRIFFTNQNNRVKLLFLGYFDSSSLEFSLISTAAYYLFSSSSASDIVGSLLRAYKRDPDTYFVSNEVRRIKTAYFLVIYYSFLSVSFSTSSLDYW